LVVDPSTPRLEALDSYRGGSPGAFDGVDEGGVDAAKGDPAAGGVNAGRDAGLVDACPGHLSDDQGGDEESQDERPRHPDQRGSSFRRIRHIDQENGNPVVV
jgi:hypothetical protein